MISDNARGSTSDLIRKEIEEFACEPGLRIRSICWRLSRNLFDFGLAKGIPLPKKDSRGRKTGDFRPIVLASLEARIVQRCVLDVLQNVPELGIYINTPYSFGGVRRKKGADSGGRRDNPSAVPAAVKAVLDKIEAGARYYVCADIKSFFTRISKEEVKRIVGLAVDDPEFMAFFSKAINTELSNMAQLREKAAAFPIEEIGVAQGNSLSPLLGNIALAKFDLEMNNEYGSCIRYIDDFIILASSAKAANAQLRRAIRLLGDLGMQLSSAKSSKQAAKIDTGFSFLGIEFVPGLVRPASTAQRKFLQTVADELNRCRSALMEFQRSGYLNPNLSLVGTLKRVSGIVDGWGKQYWFCNDVYTFRLLDSRITAEVRDFLGFYRVLRSKLPADKKNLILGIPELEMQIRNPYSYPSLRS